jgi:hypothetical protein
MLCTASAHCRIQKRRQPIVSISIRLATAREKRKSNVPIGNCRAHLVNTAEYSSKRKAAPWFHFDQTRNSKRNTQVEGAHRKMLRTPGAHCRTQKHRQLIGPISIRLAATREKCKSNVPIGKCSPHQVHTAEYRSTSNQLVPFRSDSQQPEKHASRMRPSENAAHS